MEVHPKTPSVKGPAEWSTGDVYIDAIAQGQQPSRLAVNAVHFTPGARTAWHTHTRGQTLYVTDGQGLVQYRGEPIVTIWPGDAVLIGRRMALARRRTRTLHNPSSP
jgi:quercetin dioxygenase-like cupin family protein